MAPGFEGIFADNLLPLSRNRQVFGHLGPKLSTIEGNWTMTHDLSDDQVERLRTIRLVDRVQALPLNQWRIGSAQALQTWWERGGGDFVRQHNRVSLSLKLRVEPRGTRSLWTVVGSAFEQHWVVQIDSNDGTVVE